MMNMNIYLTICSIFLSCIYNCQSLKTVQDDDVMNLIRSETYVIVLFSSKQCQACDNFENALTNVEEEFSKTFSGWTVKVVNSQLTRLYSPTKEPVLVFFRHGVPLLYHGEPAEELILHTFLNNKEPVVKELTDETFEHLTQVATGATTGDWFVMFYTPDCIDCHRLQARWEAVGAQLKSRMNVARINKATDGSATAMRFKIFQVPSFILFRHGKMYRYQIQKYDIASFTSFAQDWYKNMKPERVPLPQSPFDEFIERIVSGLHGNTLLWQMSLVSSIFGVILIILFIKCKGRSKQKQKTVDKKESKNK